ncbi:GNAT family N-acetyltransferase [Rhodovulum euryhalinum]|uniref:N-acetylglutamate synthase-like GNAT family acetyltransferase n=1 Tax=Rhodovulum euryhalinum TaxID=35805 RepID=A0A4R2KG78_9RHOB|nr:GNAT family N-acetyltransferase [Rhodovulum euryhalinum]TCO72104.1 N-acetylglutamate synthase-like GNAT family acetyltransferase [Rhodovulum euryhalinum]
MAIIIRQARRAELGRIVGLFVEDQADAILEALNMDVYEVAFDAMEAERDNLLIVGEENGRIVACYQLACLSGLVDHGARRALVAGLRVAADRAGQGIEARMLEDAKSRARALRCRLIEIAEMPETAADLLDGLGFTASGTTYRQRLD